MLYCVYGNEDDISFTPAIPCKAVDTTSAGDSFIGALIVKLADGLPLNQAIEFATKVASITVSRNGAAKSISFINEVF